MPIEETQGTIPNYLANGQTIYVPAQLAAPAAPKPDASADPLWLKLLEQIVALVKALAWPFLVVLLLILFHDPIRQVADQLPGVVSQAQKISVGGLSMEIQAQARRAGGSGLADALHQLDPGDIEELIHTGRGGWGLTGTGMTPLDFSLPGDTEMAKLRRLERVGLLDVTMDRYTSNGSRETISFTEFNRRLNASGARAIHPEWTGDRRYFTLPTAQPTEDQRRLLRTEYELTLLGKNAFQSILNAITADLSQGTKAEPAEKKKE